MKLTVHGVENKTTPPLLVGAYFLCIFLKSFKISIDIIPYIRYN
nr:MAG TPA: hypothetical protein [Caudoviricetes sp.]